MIAILYKLTFKEQVFSCAKWCILYQKNIVRKYSNDMKKNKNNNVKESTPKLSQIRIPKEFSKSTSYPSRMKLHRISAESSQPLYSNKTRYLSFVIGIGILVFIIYAFMFSTYNVEVEENLCNQLPGYKEYMMKTDPKYEEKLNKLRAEKFRKAN